MGLFGLFSKKHDIYRGTVLEIARIISSADKAVVKEMQSCIANPKKYAEHHKVYYIRRSVDIENAKEHALMWIGLADCLIRHGYAQEFDWKCEKDDFVDFISHLKTTRALGCEINPVLLYDDDDVSSWCAAQDKIWYTRNACIGGIDIDSDSYVLFVCGTDALAKLRSLAADIHKRITYGREL